MQRKKIFYFENMKHLFYFLRGMSIFVTICGALLFFVIPFASFDAPKTNYSLLPYATGMLSVGLIIFVISSKYLQIPLLIGNKQISRFTQWGNWAITAGITLFLLQALFPFAISISLPVSMMVLITGFTLRRYGKR